MTSLSVPINITSDGDFEETEQFSVILSVRDFHLQLNVGRAINLRQRVCMDKEIFSISGRDVQSDEMVSIDLDRIFVSETGNGISFNLAANESERVSVSPARTSVTIFDSDSKLTLKFAWFNLFSVCYTTSRTGQLMKLYFSPL